jgi:hypothetical protein
LGQTKGALIGFTLGSRFPSWDQDRPFLQFGTDKEALQFHPGLLQLWRQPKPADHMADEDTLAVLEKRLGRRQARQRLGIEKDHEAQVFGHGLNFFHIENLPLSRA